MPRSRHRKPSQPPDRVFVYGTLKQAEHNNRFMQYADGKFIGEAVTLKHFPLVIDGLPYLLPRPGYGTNVFGEVFEVPRWGMLKVLDSLEGHPDWYFRDRISVSCNGAPTRVWAYFLNDRDIPNDWKSKTMFSRFSLRTKNSPCQVQVQSCSAAS